MTMEALIIVLFFGLTTSLAVSYGITATLLDQKTRIGYSSVVEFSKHFTGKIYGHECSEKEMEETVKKLEKTINGGRHLR